MKLHQQGYKVLFSFLLACFGALIFLIPACAQSPGNIMFQPQFGKQKILLIRVIYPDHTTPLLNDQQAMQHAATTKAIVHANSYGQLEIEYDITPVLMMPQPSTFYMVENRLSFVRLRADAIKLAAEAGYPESDYDKEGIYTKKVWPQPFTGIGGVNRRTYYMTLFNPALMIHELGHLFDFRHASFWRVQGNNPLDTVGELIEYGDKFSQMGDFSNPGHYNPWNKTRVGWIPRKNIKTVTETGNFIIQALEKKPQEDSIVGAYSALRIRRSLGREYWVYYRNQEDSASAGALIMTTEPRNSAASVLLDMNPGSKPRLRDHLDAELEPGKTFSDVDAGLNITLLGKNADSLAVKVELTNTNIERLPAINLVHPEFTKGVHSGVIRYEVTAFDPDVEEKNGAGIDSVLLVLGYPEGDDPFGEGTEFITKAVKLLTKPPYIMEIDSDTLPDESYRLQIIAKSKSSKVNRAVFNHIIDNTGPSTPTSIQKLTTEDQLLSCFPNPFSNRVSFSFHNSTHNAMVELNIFNSISQKVKTLVDSRLPYGNHVFHWDGKADHSFSTNGLNLCQLRIDGKLHTVRLLRHKG